MLQTSLPFTKASSLTLRVIDAAGNTVAQGSGGSPLAVSGTVVAGTYTVQVSGSNRASFTLTITAPSA